MTSDMVKIAINAGIYTFCIFVAVEVDHQHTLNMIARYGANDRPIPSFLDFCYQIGFNTLIIAAVPPLLFALFRFRPVRIIGEISTILLVLGTLGFGVKRYHSSLDDSGLGVFFLTFYYSILVSILMSIVAFMSIINFYIKRRVGKKA